MSFGAMKALVLACSKLIRVTRAPQDRKLMAFCRVAAPSVRARPRILLFLQTIPVPLNIDSNPLKERPQIKPNY